MDLTKWLQTAKSTATKLTHSIRLACLFCSCFIKNAPRLASPRLAQKRNRMAADCQEQRRVSLQQRAVEARHHRDIDEENRHEDLAEQANDQLLQAADSRDVKSYKTQLAARDRASLCYRAKEAKLHRLLEESQTIVAKEIEQDNNVLEAQARTDVKIYLAKCKVSARWISRNGCRRLNPLLLN